MIFLHCLVHLVDGGRNHTKPKPLPSTISSENRFHLFTHFYKISIIITVHKYCFTIYNTDTNRLPMASQNFHKKARSIHSNSKKKNYSCLENSTQIKE